MAPPTAEDLWKDAYNEIKKSPEGDKLLKKLNETIREEQLRQGKPVKKVRSEDGHKQMLAIINQKSAEFVNKKSSENFGKICDLMVSVKDVVAAGAAANPFATIAVSGLFMAFSMNQIYRSEKQAMFNTAKTIANIIVRHNTGERAITRLKTDDKQLRELRLMLQFNYIDLYRTVLEALARLVGALYGDWQVLKNIFKLDDWEGVLSQLEKADRVCNQYRNEIHLRNDDLHKKDPSPKTGFENRQRNPLHQAVALDLPDKVFDLVVSGEYDINALTRQKWTAISLAAEIGSTKIVRTLLEAKGIKLDLQNVKGQTALWIAASRNRVGVLKLLLERKAKIDIRDNDGRTGFLVAARAGYTEVIKVLKGKGQNMNEATQLNGWTALHLAAEKNRVETVEYLLANGSGKWTKIKGGEMAGMNAKQIAEKKGNTKIVELFSA